MSLPHRIDRVDALRGFALFGILIVNIWAFGTGYYGAGIIDPGGDPAVRFVVSTLFETKFYLLFSFLFGYSFTLQLDSAVRADAAFVPRIVRRQLGLAAIGVAHAVLLFHGDILTTYAVLGLVLLALRGLAVATAVRVAFWLVGIAGVALALLGFLESLAPTPVDTTAISAQITESVAAFRGGPGGVVAEHLRQLPGTLVFVLLIQAPSALAMFLLGFAAGRTRVLAHPENHQALWAWLLRAGLPIGLAGAAVYGYAATFHPGGPAETMAMGLSVLTAPLLTGGYVAALLRLFQTRAVHVFAPVGRLALTNYVGQSAVLSVVFLGYGLGLIGRLPDLAVIGFAVALYAAQVAVSAWWVRRHRYGPLEWLLRAVTLGRRPELARR
ncbi:DUF418 domain-containing protein [Alloactinosynnema sp. L-07]|uniref:DUF418 domain-containing protein n=1 Tax=Alloactinosynnema sp. L-07 TaxID=1653480 RepID=UPI0012FA9D8E|nr:DUF418 domain-containing protein [Alloactinosynnema sp. L-07]